MEENSVQYAKKLILKQSVTFRLNGCRAIVYYHNGSIYHDIIDKDTPLNEKGYYREEDIIKSGITELGDEYDAINHVIDECKRIDIYQEREMRARGDILHVKLHTII